jgi:hypothetical protein
MSDPSLAERTPSTQRKLKPLTELHPRTPIANLERNPRSRPMKSPMPKPTQPAGEAMEDRADPPTAADATLGRRHKKLNLRARRRRHDRRRRESPSP